MALDLPTFPSCFLSGTGLEASLNARLRLTLHKQDSLPALVKVGFDVRETWMHYEAACCLSP